MNHKNESDLEVGMAGHGNSAECATCGELLQKENVLDIPCGVHCDCT